MLKLGQNEVSLHQWLSKWYMNESTKMCTIPSLPTIQIHSREMTTFLVFWNVMFCEQLNSNAYFQYLILCLIFDHRKCSDFSMKLVWKTIVFTKIFKYFLMPSVSLHSGYVFTLWHETRFLDIALDSKWNNLSHSCFCSLFFLLVWMYLFWF